MIKDKIIVAFTNDLLTEATKRGILISPLKLQKLLYFCAGIYLAKNDRLIADGAEFEAWALGPVMREVYFEFKKFGNQQITQKAVCEDGTVYELSKGFTAGNEAIKQCLDEYGHFSAAHLVTLTHHGNGAWDKAYQDGKGTIIKRNDIKQDFKEYAPK